MHSYWWLLFKKKIKTKKYPTVRSYKI